MICPKCGGEIQLDQNCKKCNIPFDEMIDSIRHDEMKDLFLKIEELMNHHKDITVEESLLACELVNSSFLVPILIEGDELSVMCVEDESNRKFITLFTDREEYERIDCGVPPRTNPFNIVLNLLESQHEGFVINVAGKNCQLTRKFIEKYFGDEIDDS